MVCELCLHCNVWTWKRKICTWIKILLGKGEHICDVKNQFFFQIDLNRLTALIAFLHNRISIFYHQKHYCFTIKQNKLWIDFLSQRIDSLKFKKKFVQINFFDTIRKYRGNMWMACARWLKAACSLPLVKSVWITNTIDSWFKLSSLDQNWSNCLIGFPPFDILFNYPLIFFNNLSQFYNDLNHKSQLSLSITCKTLENANSMDLQISIIIKNRS